MDGDIDRFGRRIGFNCGKGQAGGREGIVGIWIRCTIPGIGNVDCYIICRNGFHGHRYRVIGVAGIPFIQATGREIKSNNRKT